MPLITTADISADGTLRYWNGIETLEVTNQDDIVPDPILDRISAIAIELQEAGFVRRHTEVGEGRAFIHDIIGNKVAVRENEVDPILEICALHAPTYWAARAAQISAIEVPTRPEDASL